MALTISEERYQEIKAGVKRKRLAAKIVEAEAINFDREPKFMSVDEFLSHLEEQSADPPSSPVPRPDI